MNIQIFTVDLPHEGQPGMKRDGFVFKDPENKRDALLGVVRILGNDLEPTSYLEKLMREAEADYASDRNITHANGKTEALAHLDSLMEK